VNERREKFRASSQKPSYEKCARKTKRERELSRRDANESILNRRVNRTQDEIKNLGKELSLTFKLSVRHVVCVFVLHKFVMSFGCYCFFFSLLSWEVGMW
jgi:hypothetical protein